MRGGLRAAPEREPRRPGSGTGHRGQVRAGRGRVLLLRGKRARIASRGPARGAVGTGPIRPKNLPVAGRAFPAAHSRKLPYRLSWAAAQHGQGLRTDPYAVRLILSRKGFDSVSGGLSESGFPGPQHPLAADTGQGLRHPLFVARMEGRQHRTDRGRPNRRPDVADLVRALGSGSRPAGVSSDRWLVPAAGAGGRGPGPPVQARRRAGRPVSVLRHLSAGGEARRVAVRPAVRRGACGFGAGRRSAKSMLWTLRAQMRCPGPGTIHTSGANGARQRVVCRGRRPSSGGEHVEAAGAGGFPRIDAARVLTAPGAGSPTR